MECLRVARWRLKKIAPIGKYSWIIASQIEKIGIEGARWPYWCDDDYRGLVESNLVENLFHECPWWIGESAKRSPWNGESVRGLGEWIWTPADESWKLCC